MSWGERSCRLYNGSCGFNPKVETCNVNCVGYSSNGRKPDSVKALQILQKVKLKPVIQEMRGKHKLRRPRARSRRA